VTLRESPEPGGDSPRQLLRFERLTDMIGGTPLVQLRHVTDGLADDVEVWVKLEFMNPGGSVKDRPARQIFEEARQSGELDGETTLIDSTSGNTGVAYAMMGAATDTDVALVMPENVSEARKHIVRTYGADIIFSDPMESSDGAIRKVQEIVDADDAGQYYYADQYSNPANPKAHRLTTAPEIWEQTDGRVTHFVAATGTSGTIMGTGRGLRERDEHVSLVGLQPDDAFHGLEGLKHMPTAIVPDIYDEAALDEVLHVSTEDGWDMAERLAAAEGIASGYSGGANVAGALRVARDLDSGVIVTIICDHADRYFDE
jgi:cysteine synthase B